MALSNNRHSTAAVGGKLLNVPGMKSRATTLPATPNRKTSNPRTAGGGASSEPTTPANAPKPPTTVVECCNSSNSSNSTASIKTVSGVLFALKHWICKHFFVSFAREILFFPIDSCVCTHTAHTHTNSHTRHTAPLTHTRTHCSTNSHAHTLLH